MLLSPFLKNVTVLESAESMLFTTRVELGWIITLPIGLKYRSPLAVLITFFITESAPNELTSIF